MYSLEMELMRGTAWVFTILCDSYDLDTHAFSKTASIYRQQDFWFCLFMSFLYVPRSVAVFFAYILALA